MTIHGWLKHLCCFIRWAYWCLGTLKLPECFPLFEKPVWQKLTSGNFDGKLRSSLYLVFFFWAYACTPSGLNTSFLQPCKSPFYIYIFSSKCNGFFFLKIITANIVSHLAWSGHTAHPASLIQINLWTYIFTSTVDVQCWICQPWIHFGYFLLSEARAQLSCNFFFSKTIMKGIKLCGYCSEIDSYAIFLTLTFECPPGWY